MSVVTAALLALGLGVLAWWVVRPLFDRRALAQTADPQIDALIESKLQIYRSIVDLERDHAAGKVSDEDRDAIRRQAEADAVRIIKQIESIDPLWTSDSIEAEIAAARARLESPDRGP